MNEVKAELLRFGGPDAIGLYLSIIETGAIRALQQGQKYNTQRHEEILVELKRLVRKFERSLVAEEKIREELSSLSDDAQTFVQVELAIHIPTNAKTVCRTVIKLSSAYERKGNYVSPNSRFHMSAMHSSSCIG